MTAASTNSIDSTSTQRHVWNVSVASDADITLTRGGTARLTVTSSGATVTGTLTATAFSGDGSALTGITSFVSGMIIMFTGSTAPGSGLFVMALTARQICVIVLLLVNNDLLD